MRSSIVVLAAAGAWVAAPAAPGAALGSAVRQPEVLVQFSAGPASALRDQALDAVDATAERPVPGVRGMRVVTVPAGESAVAAAEQLDARRGVAWAMPNRLDARLFAIPDDPAFGSLWALRNTGQLVEGIAGIPGADTRAPSAWDVTTGARDVAVAVVDSGVAPAHPDLAANIDTAAARNFVPPYSDRAAYPYTSGVDPSKWDDPAGHGTHVAGTIAAVGNNGLGVSGVSWRAPIVPVRIGYFDGSVVPEASSAYSSLAWAATHARVVNMSFGGERPPGSAEQAAYETVFAQYPDTLFVAAAGNGDDSGNGVDNDGPSRMLPCATTSPNLICVAATNALDGLARFSNYGATTVDLGAPGVNILSTQQAFASPFDDPDLTGFAGWTQAPAASWTTYVVGTTHVVQLGDDATSLAAGTRSLTLPPVAASGRDCRLSVLADVDLAPVAGDFEVWAGATGMPVRKVLDAGARTGSFEVDLSDFDGASGLEVEFRASGGAAIYGRSRPQFVLMGDPTITCVTDQPARGEYGYKSGTSMAAPIVSGAAALLLSRRPDLTVAELRRALLDTTTRVPALTGKTVTGGRLDIAAAMASIAVSSPSSPAAAPPPPTTPMALRLTGAQPVGLRLRNGRALRIPLECSGTASQACTMVLELRYRVPARRGAPARWRVIGRVGRSVPAGWRGAGAITLTAFGRRLVADRRATAVVVRTTPSAGSSGLTSSGRARILVR